MCYYYIYIIRYQDLIKALPAPFYTHRNGQLNLAARYMTYFLPFLYGFFKFFITWFSIVFLILHLFFLSCICFSYPASVFLILHLFFLSCICFSYPASVFLILHLFFLLCMVVYIECFKNFIFKNCS